MPNCAADFSLLNLPKGKSLGRSKPATSSYAQALQHTIRDDFYYIQALLNHRTSELSAAKRFLYSH
jgi:hypothetical protein